MFETSHILSNFLKLSHVLSTLLDQSRARNSIGNRRWDEIGLRISRSARELALWLLIGTSHLWD